MFLPLIDSYQFLRVDIHQLVKTDNKNWILNVFFLFALKVFLDYILL